MSTLNRALKSLQMIKFARRTNFYWRSYLDPEADAYDAVKQEILNKQEALASQAYNVKGTAIPRDDADDAFATALRMNDALARSRRNRVWRSTPHIIGAAGGGLAGAGLGYWGSSNLSKALGLTPDKGGWRKWTGHGINLGGTLLGAATGAALGGNIGSNWYVNSENTAPFSNGTDILTFLNNDLDTSAAWPTDAKDDEKHLDFINTNAANKARSEAKKRKEDVMAKRSTKK